MIKREEKNIGRKSWGSRMRGPVLPERRSVKSGLSKVGWSAVQCSVSQVAQSAGVLDHALLEEWICYYILHTQHEA